MNKYFWNESDNELVYQFKTEQDHNKRNRIFNQLYKSLFKLIEIAIRSLGLEVTEDIVQDCMLRLYHYTIPMMDIERIKAAQQYIFISLKRYLMSYHMKIKHTHISLDIIQEDESFGYNNIDNVCDTQDYRTIIDNYLDCKISKIKILNTNEMYFLLLLKNYLIINEYDVKGFKKYFNDINFNKDNRIYNQICVRLGISMKVFN